jgi:hypothetical protein
LPTVAERLAVELHRQYRAAEKALRCTDEVGKRPYWQHDHGWQGCHRKEYFIQRAERIIRHSRIENPETLGDAECKLDADVLLRSLGVNPEPVAGVDLKAKDFSDGGMLPQGKYYIVGENATDAADMFPTRFHERGYAQLKQKDIDNICAIFHLPQLLVTGNTGDARHKAERDAVIRKTLWGKKSAYTVTVQQ